MSMYYLNPKTGKYELQGAPHVDAYSKEQTDALIAENAGLQMELLWENASPSSTFTTQTITLGLNNGEFALLLYREYWDHPQESYKLVEVGKPFTIFNNRYQMGYRDFEWSDGNLLVANDMVATVYPANQTMSNNVSVIPYKIYKVNGVNFNE